MNYVNEIGTPTRVSVTGTLSIGNAAGNIGLLGILVGACQTAPGVQIWMGQTTGLTTIIGMCTLPLNTYTRIPVYCSGGATFNFLNCIAPDLQIYWNPLGP